MKRIIAIMIFAALMLPLCSVVSADQQLYSDWTIKSDYNNKIQNDLANNKQIMEKKEALIDQYKTEISERKDELVNGRIKKIKINGYTMEVYMKKIGKAPKNGYPVFINLHGGGTDDAQMQREQYQIMIDFDTWDIKSGLYIVPKGIIVGGEEHSWPESFLFYDRIIEDCILFHNADPNRIYLMGFSSGGDGVYNVTPFMADRFAAVDMRAGSPSSFWFENLSSVAMRIRMGELDDAYKRNIRAAQVDGILNNLAQKYGGGYVHQTMLYSKNGHNDWNENENGQSWAITGKEVQTWLKTGNGKATLCDGRYYPWLSQYTRDPLPRKVVWYTASFAALRKNQGLYWLDRDGKLRDVTVVASYNRNNNSVTIEECNATDGTLKIMLNPDMLNVFKPVKVRIGRQEVSVQPVVTTQIMSSTLKSRGDPNLVFCSEIDITFDENKKQILVNPASTYNADYDVRNQNKLIYWNDDGVFFVDESLFGLTYNEIEKKLNVSLTKPEKWPFYEGKDNMTFSYCPGKNNESVIFLFDNDKAVTIYAETEGAISDRIDAAVRKVYYNTWHIRTDGTMAYYYLDENPYDGKGHTMQSYSLIYFYIPRDWWNGNGRD